MTEVHVDPTLRHDFVLLFDVQDGNPNGDPDAGNLPRIDPETMNGLVTDVAIKRKVRDFVDMAHGSEGRNKIYVQNEVALNTQHQRAYDALKLQTTGTRQDMDAVRQARQWMCQNFYDIRMFGAVMTTKVNAGQVRGPLQLTFARSMDPIVPMEIAITRIAVTREEDRKVEEDSEGKGKSGKQSEMGRKALIPYGLYRAHGFFNPHFAKSTGANSDDLALFWTALRQTWEYDRSASRGMMTCRGIYVFTHAHPLGNAPAHELFESIGVERKPAVAAPRRFADYSITIPNQSDLPEGITLTEV